MPRLKHRHTLSHYEPVLHFANTPITANNYIHLALCCLLPHGAGGFVPVGIGQDEDTRSSPIKAHRPRADASVLEQMGRRKGAPRLTLINLRGASLEHGKSCALCRNGPIFTIGGRPIYKDGAVRIQGVVQRVLDQAIRAIEYCVSNRTSTAMALMLYRRQARRTGVCPCCVESDDSFRAG